MNDTDKLSESLTTQRAAEWFIANRGGELSASEREVFVAWLKASPVHMREYLAISNTSGDLAKVARTSDADLQTLLQSAADDHGASVVSLGRAPAALDAHVDTASQASRRRGWMRGLGIAASLCAIALTAMLTLRDGERFGLPRAYETAHAEQTSWRLPDGSVMHLNSDSRVTVRFSGEERLITLDRGQAHFQVTRDPARRFRVATDRADVIAVGTAFDVYRRPEATVVTVVEGKVAVVQPHAKEQGKTAEVPTSSDHTSKAGQSDSLESIAERIELTAGQRLEMTAGVRAPEAMQVNLRESTAWLQRQIVFEHERLEDVAAEFNRYSRTPIDIEDAELRDLRLSGAFNAYDMDSFVGFLERLDNVTVESGSARIQIHRKEAFRNETEE